MIDGHLEDQKENPAEKCIGELVKATEEVKHPLDKRVPLNHSGSNGFHFIHVGGASKKSESGNESQAQSQESRAQGKRGRAPSSLAP